MRLTQQTTLALVVLILTTLACNMTTAPNAVSSSATDVILTASETPVATVAADDNTTADNTALATENLIAPADEPADTGIIQQESTTTRTIDRMPPNAIAMASVCVPRTDWTVTYTVVRGDTLASIGRRAGINYRTLAEGNCIVDANTIETGQVLRLPVALPVLPPTATPSGSIVAIQQVTINDAETEVVVRGMGSGLFEGTLIVRVLDANSQTIVSQPVTMATDEVGGAGTWRVALNVANSSTQGTGTVQAFATSPRDGSMISMSQQPISFGMSDDTSADPSLIIQQVTINDAETEVVVRGMGSGLFEGTLIVRVLDANSQTIVSQPVTMATAEVGGAGTWRVALNVANSSTQGTGTVQAFATSPRDGSMITMSQQPISFDFNTQPDSNISINWTQWDSIITPDSSGHFTLRGRTDHAAGMSVRVYLADVDTEILAGTERTVMTDNNGNWEVTDMRVSQDTTGNYQVVATLQSTEGRVIATDVQNVILAENPSAASQRVTTPHYILNVPRQWHNIRMGSGQGFATYPPSNPPPGAAYSPYTMEVSVSTQPLSDAGSVQRAIEQITQAAVGEVTQYDMVMSDGTEAVYLTYAGGTGKLIQTMVFTTDTRVVTVSGTGDRLVIMQMIRATQRGSGI